MNITKFENGRVLTLRAWFNTGFQLDLFKLPVCPLTVWRQEFYVATPSLRLARTTRIAFVMLDLDGGRE